MPYTASNVPSYVPKKKAAQWAAIFNASLEAGDKEEVAFKKANGGIRNKEYGNKVSQVQAAYNSLGMTGDTACANCNWYMPEWDECRVVAGTISPTGLSNLYMPMLEYVPEPVPVVIVAGETKSRIKSAAQSIPVLGKLFGEGQEFDSPITLFKSADGQLRFFCHPSNCFRDREWEILTSDAHKEYAAWVTDNPDYYPELQIWHTKGCKVGQVEWVDYADDFLCAAGVVYKEYEEQVIKAVQLGAGMSHGFIPVQKGLDIVAYRSFEFTILPVEHACNTWTDFNVLNWSEKDMGFTAEKRKYFETLGFKPEQIATFEASAKGMSEGLRAMGVDHKDISETDEAPSMMPQLVALTDAVTAMTGVVATLATNQKAQAEEIAATKAIAETANKSVDEKVAEQFKAKVDEIPAGFVASQSASTVDAEASAKLKENPEADFFKLLSQQALTGSGIQIPNNGLAAIPQASQQGGNN
jgi:hypothetical protein